MSSQRPNHTRKYSHSWSYPGYYAGYESTIPFEDGAFCIMPESDENQSCSSNFYEYIHLCKGYPFDLKNLDKPIDLMSNPNNTYFDLNG